MTLARRTLSSLAALGLAVTTAITAMPAQNASAGPLPDVAVKYDGYNYGAGGQLNVAFGITNKDAPANNVTLDTTCNYRYKSDNNPSRKEYGKITLSLLATQSNPVPKLVSCAPGATEYVSSVIMYANVPGGDSNTSNNTAIWDWTKLPQPDVKVGYLYRWTNQQGWVKVGFGLTDTLADAPEVRLHATCNYRYNANNVHAGKDDQYQTISLKKNQNAELKEVYCAARPGQYVSSVFLHAEVQKPWVDANISNNSAYWDRVSMG
ncbi:MAG TPA: hypothetical protein VFH48_31490 [Chloroflexota bacterium]|jgi:hypothetical protein|nr:hypothetical protein [Chloroflexota bacterium]